MLCFDHQQLLEGACDRRKIMKIYYHLNLFQQTIIWTGHTQIARNDRHKPCTKLPIKSLLDVWMTCESVKIFGWCVCFFSIFFAPFFISPCVKMTIFKILWNRKNIFIVVSRNSYFLENKYIRHTNNMTAG